MTALPGSTQGSSQFANPITKSITVPVRFVSAREFDALSRGVATTSTSQEPAPTPGPAAEPKDEMAAPPYFAEGVYARARAARDRLAAANRARIEGPKLLAQSIRDLYEPNTLVQVLRETIAEVGKAERRPMGYMFKGPRLALTEGGFCTRRGFSVRDRVSLGDCRDAIAARKRIDAQLVMLAEDPEAHLRAFEPDSDDSDSDADNGSAPARAGNSGRARRASPVRAPARRAWDEERWFDPAPRNRRAVWPAATMFVA